MSGRRPASKAGVETVVVDRMTYRDALERATEVPLTTRAVCYILAQRMNKDGSNAWGRLDKLAAYCGLGERATAGHLSAAVKVGYLKRTSSGHKGHTATYRACIPSYRWDPIACKILQAKFADDGPTESGEDASAEPIGCKKATSKAADICSPTPELHPEPLKEQDQKIEGSADAPSPQAATVDDPWDLPTPSSFEPLPPPNYYTEPLEWIEHKVYGFDGCEQTMADSMLCDGQEPKKILAKILKDREGVPAGHRSAIKGNWLPYVKRTLGGWRKGEYDYARKLLADLHPDVVVDELRRMREQRAA